MSAPKPEPPPYFKFWVHDFIDGTRTARMQPEQIGFYTLFLGLQWRDQGPLADDMPLLAKRLDIQVRTVRRLVDELVKIGPRKITRAGGKLWNPRMQREIDAYNRALMRKLRAAADQRGEGGKGGLLPLGLALINGGRRGRR
jgi:uncharacterized protein YdaU (DUF1376 family)